MEPLVTQRVMDLAILGFIGAVAIGWVLVGMEVLVKHLARKFWGRRDVLPPPDQAAERKVYRWKEDME